MNIPELRRLIDHLKALPPIPDFIALKASCMMGAFRHETACGTVGCICGEWFAMNGRPIPETVDTDEFMIALELTAREEYAIIFADDWVGGFRERHKELHQAYKINDLNAERALMIEYLEWIAEDPERFRLAVAA